MSTHTRDFIGSSLLSVHDNRLIAHTISTIALRSVRNYCQTTSTKFFKMNKVQIFEDIHKGYQQNDPELVNACITPIIQEYGREHPIMGYIWGCVYFNALSHEEVSWAGELNQDTVYDHVFRDSFRLDQIFDALLGYIKSDLSSDDQLIGKIVDRLRELSEYQGAERYADYNGLLYHDT